MATEDTEDSVILLVSRAFGITWDRIRAAHSAMWVRVCTATGSPVSASTKSSTFVASKRLDVLPPAINEEDWEKFQKKAGVLFPTAPRKFAWDVLMLMLILYSSITVPFRIALSHPAEGAWWFVEVVVSLCFIGDLGLTFCTAYMVGLGGSTRAADASCFKLKEASVLLMHRMATRS